MTTALDLPDISGPIADMSIALGNYHVKVQDAAFKSASTGRKQLVIQTIGYQDPNHAAKEGKKITKIFQSLPQAGDEDDKAAISRFFLKRCFEGFGVKFTEGLMKRLDPRVLVGKDGWIQIGDRPGQDGQPRRQCVAISATPEGLPVAKTNGVATNGDASKDAKPNGAARRR